MQVETESDFEFVVPVGRVQGGTTDNGRQHDENQHGKRGNVNARAGHGALTLPGCATAAARPGTAARP
jgi:hypothetical protein